MSTVYNANSRSITVVAYDQFNRTTGDPGNIDDVLGATSEQCTYSGGSLIVAGRYIGQLDLVGVDDGTDAPIALSPAEIAADWTED